MKSAAVVLAIVVFATVNGAFAADQVVPQDDENNDQDILYQEVFGDKVLLYKLNETESFVDWWNDEGFSHRIQELEGALFQADNQAEFLNESIPVQPGTEESVVDVANSSTIMQPGTEEFTHDVANTSTTVQSIAEEFVDDVANTSTTKPITPANVLGGPNATSETNPLNIFVTNCQPLVWGSEDCDFKCFMNKKKEFKKCKFLSHKIQNLLLLSLGLNTDVRVEYGVRNVTLEITIPL